MLPRDYGEFIIETHTMLPSNTDATITMSYAKVHSFRIKVAFNDSLNP